MASSIISYWCFNDNTATLVHDFSGNQRHSIVETGFSISTAVGAVGKVGVFDGSTTRLDFDNITAFSALTAFAVICKFKLDAVGARQVISMRSGNHILEVTAAGKVKLSLYDASATLYTCTHADTLVVATWYTVVAMWDGSDITIYVNEADNETTAEASFGELDTVSNNLYVGATNTPGDYLDGFMEMLSYYSKALDYDEVEAIMESPSGLVFEAGDGKIQTGDIIYNESGSKEVCIWYQENEERSFPDDEDHLWADGTTSLYSVWHNNN